MQRAAELKLGAPKSVESFSGPPGVRRRIYASDLIACSYFSSSLGLSVEASYDLLFMTLCPHSLGFGSVSQTTILLFTEILC